jgi:hypothetical protein
MSKVSVMHKMAVALPVLLLAAFNSFSASATSVFLGTVSVVDELSTETCFADCDNHSFESFSTGTSSLVAPDSSAQTKAVISTIPSLSARSEADTLKEGGSDASSFRAGGKAAVTLHYFFAVEGPQNISITSHLTANGSIGVTGDFASTGYNFLAEASLTFGPAPRQDIFIEDDRDAVGGTISNSFAIDGKYDLDTNTGYEVLIQVTADAFLTEENPTFTALANLIATASIDPSIEIDPAFAKDYKVVFSDGLSAPTAATTPLPAALPLFASGLGAFGVIGWRRKKKATSLVAQKHCAA